MERTRDDEREVLRRALHEAQAFVTAIIRGMNVDRRQLTEKRNQWRMALGYMPITKDDPIQPTPQREGR